MEALLALGRHGDAIPELEALVAEHPLEERLHGQLMLALYRSGRQAEALDLYRETRRVLRDELGLEPGPALQGLQQGILRQDPALALEAQRLRGYRLLEEIGAGAFGVVHRAIQPHVGREVAVKVIRPELADDPRFVRRFETEAQLVARLEHPRIVPLYDYWREPGAAYLVMRWLRGGSLKETIAEGPLALDWAAQIVEQVAAGLALAHREGIVHGDVKPANILLDEGGDAYLSDFGIAMEVAAEVTPSSPETAAYRSPEQARGERLTPRSDIYTLGVLLREALAGSDFPDAVGAVIEQATADDPSDRYEDAPALAIALRDAVGARRAVAPAVEGRNPYKGLRFFTQADAGDFFGREALVERLLGRLAGGARLLALVGPSGSGKSSAARAGLLARLPEGRITRSEEWYAVEMFPGAHPLRELEAALLRVATEPRAGLIQLLERDDRGLVAAVADLLPGGDAELVLLVDQLEEVFTLVDDEEERGHFLALLAAAASDPRSRIRVVITLRADFFDRPLEYEAFAELLRSGVETVIPLSPTELERAIALPAQRAGIEFEPGLVGEIVADVAGQPGALPLVEYALTELFERRRSGVLTLDAYAEIGGISGAVARRAEELHDTASEEGRQAIRQLFLRLVTVGEASDEARRRVTRAELASLEVDQSVVEEIIEAFGRHRLLSFDRDPQTREPTVEIAHEALLRVWARLRGWLDEAREDVLMQRRLTAATREWEASQRDPSFLLRGSRLDLFDSWAATAGVALARAEREYLETSLAERAAEQAAEAARQAREAALERRSLRRLRALVGVLALAALAATGLTIFALAQQSRAERSARLAVARELATAADANLEVDPERSILLALEAVETTRSVDGSVLREAEQALQNAVAASRLLVTVRGAGGSVGFGPDGRRFVGEGTRGAAAVWNATTGKQLLSLGREVDGVDYSPDGKLVATAGQDGAAAVWEVTTGRKVATVNGGGPLLSAEFGPDGDVLATVTNAGEVRLWQLPTGRKLLALEAWSGAPPVPPKADLVAFDASGQRLAVVSAAPGRVAARVWDLRSGAVLLVVPLTADFPPHDVDLSPNGALLAIAQWDGSAELRDVRTGEVVLAQPVTTGDLWEVEFSPDGTRLATAAGDGFARVFEIQQRSLRELFVLGRHAALTNASFSPDGARLVTGGDDGTTRVWDIAHEGPRALLTLPGTPGQFSGGVSFTPDGRRLVATSRPDRIARLWDAASGEELLALEGHHGTVHAVAVSLDGTRIATASVDSTASVWNAATGKQLWSTTIDDDCRALGPLCPSTSVAFSPDGALVAVGSAGATAHILDTETGRRLHVLAGHRAGVFGVSFSPDGTRLATGSWDGTAKIWQTRSGRNVMTLDPSSREIQDVGFSPAGDRLFTVGADGMVRAWDAASGRQLLSWPGNQGDLFGLAVSADGARLATSGGDATIKLWDAASGEELLTLPRAPFVLELAFSPDGARLASSEQFGMVRVWALDIDELIDLARSRVTRPLTEEECRQYLHASKCPRRG